MFELCLICVLYVCLMCAGDMCGLSVVLSGGSKSFESANGHYTLLFFEMDFLIDRSWGASARNQVL